jgi:hypothetical protein
MQFGMSDFTRGEEVSTSTARLPAHPILAAHTAPPAISVMPAMNRIVSARVNNQLLRMLRLNRWTVPGVGWHRTVNEGLMDSLNSAHFEATPWRPLGAS